MDSTDFLLPTACRAESEIAKYFQLITNTLATPFDVVPESLAQWNLHQMQINGASISKETTTAKS